MISGSMFIYQRVCEIGCWMQFKACVSAVLCLAVLNHDQAYDERQPKHQNMANGTQDVGELWLQCWLSRACGERNGPTEKDGHVGEKRKSFVLILVWPLQTSWIFGAWQSIQITVGIATSSNAWTMFHLHVTVNQSRSALKILVHLHTAFGYSWIQ